MKKVVGYRMEIEDGRIIVERDNARGNVFGLWIQDGEERIYTELTIGQANELAQMIQFLQEG